MLWRMKLLCLAMSSITLHGQMASSPLSPPATAISAAVKAAYQREFGETIEYPAIYDNPHPVDCSGKRYPPITTTAYLGVGPTATLLTMHLSADGTVQSKARSQVRLAPAGKIRILCVLVRYPETVAADALALWEDAQNSINEDHRAFARSRGYRAPIVVFDNTNIMIDHAEINNPHHPSAVRAAAQHREVSSSGYQIIMTIDINPKEVAGGLSIESERSVYVGNYGPWRTPLNARMWNLVAATAYHHEVAHHWGWPADHDWVVSCAPTPGYAPFIVPPVLFGWEDLQGNHVPEILSPTPYGRGR